MPQCSADSLLTCHSKGKNHPFLNQKKWVLLFRPGVFINSRSDWHLGHKDRKRQGETHICLLGMHCEEAGIELVIVWQFAGTRRCLQLPHWPATVVLCLHVDTCIQHKTLSVQNSLEPAAERCARSYAWKEHVR